MEELRQYYFEYLFATAVDQMTFSTASLFFELDLFASYLVLLFVTIDIHFL